MSIDKKTVEKLAHLARLELTEVEKIKMMADLEKIIHWVEKLGELNTDNVEPLRNVNEETVVLRDDVASNYFQRGEALLNAPEKDDTYFIVPKVL